MLTQGIELHQLPMAHMVELSSQGPTQVLIHVALGS